MCTLDTSARVMCLKIVLVARTTTIIIVSMLVKHLAITIVIMPLLLLAMVAMLKMEKEQVTSSVAAEGNTTMLYNVTYYNIVIKLSA